jgi:hypothetical protein
LQLAATSPAAVRELVAPIMHEFALNECRLLLAGFMARVNPEADVSLLEGDILLVEGVNKPRDPRGGEETFLFLNQFYLQPVHSANCVKTYTVACRRELSSTPP